MRDNDCTVIKVDKDVFSSSADVFYSSPDEPIGEVDRQG
jgi:hypothetical protein